MIRDILISILVTILVSAAVSFVGMIVYNADWVQIFVAAIFVQIAGFYLWNSFMQYRMKVGLEQEETKRISMYETQGVESQCAYCNAINYIPIRLNDDNNYECTECKNVNSVYVQITTARTTDIQNKSAFEISTYIKDKVDATKSIKGE